MRLRFSEFRRWVNLIGWAGLAIGNLQLIAPCDETVLAAGLAWLAVRRIDFPALAGALRGARLAPLWLALLWHVVATTIARVRRCQGSKCVLFYYDVTKSGTRRWCSMSGCGNREKAAAHYARVRGFPSGRSR